MSLYLKPAVPDPDHTPATLPVALTRLRALVVDDEESLADLVGVWLSELGFETRRATDSATALEIAKEFRPHLLVSDSNLGEAIDGAELAARITSDLPTLVTVFMTGFSDSLRALETVGALTLVKPFSKDDLNAALIKVLGARLAASTPTGAGPR
ncbi:MAG: response regulator [Actinobacteria bacterium]|nr:response regulator [Actinomycetota bacterium]